MLESLLFCLQREPQRAEVAATKALAIVEERSFTYISNVTRPMLGWAWAQLGRAGEGVAIIRQGLAGLAEAGQRVPITEVLTFLAKAQTLEGKLEDALITIEKALQANPEELVYRPDALICRGELRLKLGQTELAEADFREAIALAQKMKAKACELRATTSLARLLDRTCRRAEAPHDARRYLQLVHRGLRHRRPERRQGAPGTAVGSACSASLLSIFESVFGVARQGDPVA
jgi:tetratricopeptide (TPR) repeat protein